MQKIKKFFKELKRVRWASGKDGWKTFWTSSLFIAIAALILFGLAILFTSLWAAGGIGI